MRIFLFLFFSWGIFFAPNTEANVANFVIKEGYHNGDITSDPRWSGSNGCIVETRTGTLHLSTRINPNLRYGDKLVGAANSQFIVGALFQFNRKQVLDLPNQFSLFRLGIEGEAYTTAGAWFIREKRAKRQGYLLRASSRLGVFSAISGNFIPESAIHSHGSLQSDRLYLKVQIKKGATARDWSAIASLYNLSRDPSMSNPVSTVECPFETTNEVFLRSSFDASISSGGGKKAIGSFFKMLLFERFVARAEPSSNNAVRQTSTPYRAPAPQRIMPVKQAPPRVLHNTTTNEMSAPGTILILVGGFTFIITTGLLAAKQSGK